MAHMPEFLQEGTPEARTWQELERYGKQQGVDPSSGPVTIQTPSPRFREAIDNLVRARGATITKVDSEGDALQLTLSYGGSLGSAPGRDPSEPVIPKPVTHKA